MHRTLRLEEDPPAKELPENAADAPDVHGGRVMPCSHQDFRCTVILRHHFLGHMLVLVRFFHSSQTEVADLLAENACNYLVMDYVKEKSIASFFRGSSGRLIAVGEFTFNTQLLFTSRFPGLMSLCRILAE